MTHEEWDQYMAKLDLPSDPFVRKQLETADPAPTKQRNLTDAEMARWHTYLPCAGNCTRA
jgi:hypothetical protein